MSRRPRIIARMHELRVKEWPADERPRERLLNGGAHKLSNAELLAVFIGSGTRGCDAIELARRLLNEFEGLRGVIRAPRGRICKLPGFGDVRYARMQAMLEIVRRSLLETLRESGTMSNPDTVREYLLLKMRDYEHEIFACMFLDNRHRLIECEEMFHGTIDTAAVHPREVVKRALHHNSAAVILVHNHPSGNSTPSDSDKDITAELQKSLELVGVRVLDHFVIGDTITSFAEEHLL